MTVAHLAKIGVECMYLTDEIVRTSPAHVITAKKLCTLSLVLRQRRDGADRLGKRRHGPEVGMVSVPQVPPAIVGTVILCIRIDPRDQPYELLARELDIVMALPQDRDKSAGM